MKLRSDELNIDQVNAALQHVHGLNLPEATKLVNKSVNIESIDPRTLQIENTNSMVGNILGGEMREQLDPSVPIYEGKKPAPRKQVSAFEAARNKHIRALAEAKTLSEFKDVLSEFKDDLKKKIRQAS
jgi:hypothetical protein